MSDRLNRKDIRHDKFVEDVGLAYGFVAKNRSKLFIAVGALFLIAAALTALVLQRSRQSVAASGKLAEAIEIMEAPVAMTPDQTTTGPQYKSEAEKLSKAEPIFKSIVDEYGSTDVADVASLYLARIAASRGNVDQARPRLEEFIEEHEDHVLATSAKYSLYEIRIAAGEGAQVAQEIETELKDEDSLIPTDAALALLGRAYEQAGNDEKSKEAYRRIINEYPDSAYTLDAQRKTLQG
jgi:tetratricopeptide (TPR) repeat protein